MCCVGPTTSSRRAKSCSGGTASCTHSRTSGLARALCRRGSLGHGPCGSRTTRVASRLCQNRGTDRRFGSTRAITASVSLGSSRRATETFSLAMSRRFVTSSSCRPDGDAIPCHTWNQRYGLRAPSNRCGQSSPGHHGPRTQRLKTAFQATSIRLWSS